MTFIKKQNSRRLGLNFSSKSCRILRMISSFKEKRKRYCCDLSRQKKKNAFPCLVSANRKRMFPYFWHEYRISRLQKTFLVSSDILSICLDFLDERMAFIFRICCNDIIWNNVKNVMKNLLPIFTVKLKVFFCL